MESTGFGKPLPRTCIAGPVYPLGGAFVEFLIREHGAAKFLRLYNESRESRFKHTFREIYDVELEAMEAEFWKDAEQPDG